MESPPGRDHRARLRLCLNVLSYAGKVIGGGQGGRGDD
jgi:hypothetical protein